MKILVTGAAGFVGRHFVKKFIEQGHYVRAVDIVGGEDARDFFRINDEHFDKVIHLAAVVGGRKMIEGSPLALAVDLAIDSELFSWALRTRPGCITYFSSSAAYPVSLQTKGSTLLLKENDIDPNYLGTPDLSYGWAKLTGEMLATHARNAGLIVHVYRPFSGYGSDQALDYPFPSFIKRGLHKDNPFEIWGDGKQVRDFIHIEDVVNGALAGCEAGIETANLCTGRATSFLDLAAIVTAVAGYTPTLKTLSDEPVGVAYRVGDPTYMETFYKPAISLEEGVERAFIGL
jgi:nucleoside-diphosphate-sugar epimerase